MKMRNKNTAVYINSLESLRAEKWALKSRLRQREQDFEERLSQLPVEVIKATVGQGDTLFFKQKGGSYELDGSKGRYGHCFSQARCRWRQGGYILGD